MYKESLLRMFSNSFFIQVYILKVLCIILRHCFFAHKVYITIERIKAVNKKCNIICRYESILTSSNFEFRFNSRPLNHKTIFIDKNENDNRINSFRYTCAVAVHKRMVTHRA